MPKFLNRLVVVVVMLGLLSWVAANALILLPFELSEWWSTFVWCFVVIWLVLDRVGRVVESPSRESRLRQPCMRQAVLRH